jgi:hypothetical protein
MDVTNKTCQQQAVSELVARQGPTAVLAVGDIQYPQGELEDFRAVFDRSFGPLKGLIRPVIGNHEYNDPQGPGEGYFDYFNGEGGDSGPAGPRSAPYYSFDVGSWHLIALDSECRKVPGGCGTDSPQRGWLLKDLADNPSRCTLAYWHRPRFTAGSEHEGERSFGVLWNDLVQGGVDVAVTAHNHNVEVLDPMGTTPPTDLVPVPDEEGIQQFVAGSGGRDLDPFVGPPLKAANGAPATTARDDDTFGVLRLVLRSDAYDWSLLGIQGTAFHNADAATTGGFTGSRRCH